MPSLRRCCRAADEYSANVCKKELIKVKNDIENIENKLSKLGTMIDDQPINTLPDEFRAYIEALESENDEK